MSSKSGNTINEEKAEKTTFAPGDVVALTQAALRLPKLQAMSCRLLYAVGMPNEFLVKKVFETPSEGVCLSLFPCCDTVVDRKAGHFRCSGHPALYFEKVSFKRMPKPGDKTASIVLPLLGEIYRAEFHDGEFDEGKGRSVEPEFVTKLFGMESSMQGSFAKMAKTLFEKWNAL